MAIIPEGKYVTDDCMQTLIQLVKNQFSASLNNTIITRMTKSAYQTLTPKNPNTVYYVTDISTGTVECYLGDTKISGEGGGGSSEIYGIPFNLSHGTTTDVTDLTQYNFVNVEYSDGSGSMSPGDNRYPGTLDYVPIPDGMTTMQLISYDTGGNGLNWCAYLYDANYSYNYAATNGNNFLDWGDNSTVRNIPAGMKYIRFYMKNSGRTELSPSDVRDAYFQYNHTIIDITAI